MAKTEIKMCCGHNSDILQCVGTKKITDYFVSWSKFDNGTVKYCKDCCDKIFKYYLEEYNDEKVALLYTLAKIDVPFIGQVYLDTLEKTNKFGNKVPLSVSSYISTLHKSQTNKDIYSDFSDTDCNVFELDIKGKTKSEKEEEINRLEKTWGIQDDISDYDFLEETFNRYTDGVDFVNSQQQDLYRDLCRDRLLLRKINDNRYNGEETIDKVQNRISKTMSILKVDQFESNKAKTLSEQSLFEKIRLCDANNVQDVYSKPSKYYDLNKIQYYNEKFSLRPLANMLVGHRDFSVNLDDIEEYDLK